VFFLFLKFHSGSGNHPQDDLAKSMDDLARFGDKTYESKNIKNPSIVLATYCKRFGNFFKKIEIWQLNTHETILFFSFF
jgi:hypothetical protein